MKLLNTTNKYNFLFLVLFSPVMLALDYFLIQYIVNSEVNEILKHESERIAYILQTEDELPRSNFIDTTILVDKATTSSGQFSDTLIYEAYAEKLIPYRKYEFITLIDSKWHKISLRHILFGN